jgi:hypothetical protein
MVNNDNYRNLEIVCQPISGPNQSELACKESSERERESGLLLGTIILKVLKV